MANVIPNGCNQEAIYVPAPDPCSGSCVLESLSVTENGLYVPSEGVDGFESVEVNVSGVGSDPYIINPDIVETFVGKARSKASAPGACAYRESGSSLSEEYRNITVDGVQVPVWSIGGSSQRDIAVRFAKVVPADATKLIVEASVESVSSSYGHISVGLFDNFDLPSDPWDPEGHRVADLIIVRHTPSSLPYQRFEVDASSVSIDSYAQIYMVYAKFNIHSMYYE